MISQSAQNEPMEPARIETFWSLSQIGRHRSNRNYWHGSNRNAWHKASEISGTIRTEIATMQRIWKQRERQIEKVTTNTIDMYGSIKGIAGNAIQSVKALELPDGDDPELDLEEVEH